MNYFRDFFKIDRRQERGILILSVIVFILILIDFFAQDLAEKPNDYFAQFNQQLEQLQLQTYEAELEAENKKEFYPKKKTSPSQPAILTIAKPVDLNIIPDEKLKKLGLPEFLVNNVLKYRSKGGKFYSPEDVRKLYGMSDELFSQMEPSLVFSEKQNRFDSKDTKSDSSGRKANKIIYEDIQLGINTADSVDLVKIKGIGAYYAGEIVKHRKQLGGYLGMYQLMELYKMDSTRFSAWSKNLYYDEVPIVKISLNNADFKVFLNHPYIDFETTEYITTKRKKLGKFASLYELKDPQKMPDSLYQMILPYLKLD